MLMLGGIRLRLMSGCRCMFLHMMMMRDDICGRGNI